MLNVMTVYSMNMEMNTVSMWKPVFGFDNYEISLAGEIRNRNNKNLLSLDINHESQEANLFISGKNHRRSVGRLLLMSWFPFPVGIDTTNIETVYEQLRQQTFVAKHLDMDPINDNHYNLQWMTDGDGKRYDRAHPSYIAKDVKGRAIIQYTLDGKFVARHDSIAIAARKIQEEHGGALPQLRDGKVCREYRWIIERFNLPGEEWISIPTFLTNGKLGYKASNKGRIKSAFDDRILITESHDGYRSITLNGKTTDVHNVIAFTFHSDSYQEGFTVNHINGNKNDNAPSNLEWGSQSFNVQEAYRTGLAKPARETQIFQVTWLKEIKGPYASYHDAQRVTSVPFGTVRNAALKPFEFPKSQGGFQWTHSRADAEELISDPKFDEKFFRVIQATKDGKFIKSYASFPDAAAACNIKDKTGINQSATKRNGSTCSGFRWFKNKAAFDEECASANAHGLSE